MIVTRAAASSTASGMPSSRRQISATAAALRLVEREAGLHRPRPLDEELHRGSLAAIASSVDVARRQLERAQRPHLLAGDAERLAARRQDAHARAVAQQPLGEPAHRVDEVLAVVEHEHELADAQRVDDARRRA